MSLPSAVTTNNLSPNSEQAATHIAALTAQDVLSAIVDFRCIHDTDKAIPAHSFRGTLAEVWPKLCDYNSRGYGVFININELDGEGRELSNVRSIRAHVVDLDNQLTAAVNYDLASKFTPAPSFAVNTSPGKYHCYWSVKPYAGNDRYTITQRKLRQLFDGDKAVIDPTRVLRVAGFYNHKYSDPASDKYQPGAVAHMATCRSLPGYDQPLAVETLEAALRHINVIDGAGGRHELGEPSLSAPSLDWLRFALSQIDPNQLDRGEWISTTAAFKQAGWLHADDAALFDIWSEWCQRYTENDAGENRKQWNSIRETEVGWKSFYRRVPTLEAKEKFGPNGSNGVPATMPGQGTQQPGRSFEQILTDAKALLHDSDNLDGVERLCAEAATLPPAKKEAVLRAVREATGLSLQTLRKQASGQDGENEPDHLELARKTLNALGSENVIHAEQFTWKFSATGVWKRCDDREIKRDVQTSLADDDFAVTATRVNGVADVLKNEIFKPHHEFNRGNPESVNCLNGELELINGQWHFQPHRRELYRTTQIPVAYDPNATAPLFWQFLHEIFRDDADRDDKINVVLEMIGYSLMSHANREKFVLLIGAGANGKSVLLATLETLLGKENIAGVQPSKFNDRFQRGHLHQKLANIVTELKKGETIADAELKAISSGEPATVEHKNKDPFVMRPFATCWFGTNHMPHTRDYSDAFFRRVIVVPFNRVFQPHEQNTGLKDKLIAELPGILNFALWAYARVVAHNGFTVPASSLEAQQKWQLEANQVAQFVDACCETRPGRGEAVGTLYNAYLQWAQMTGIRQTLGKNQFGDRLEQLGHPRGDGTGHVRLIRGLALKERLFWT